VGWPDAFLLVIELAITVFNLVTSRRSPGKRSRSCSMYGVIVIEREKTILAKRFRSVVAARASLVGLARKYPEATFQLREGDPPGEEFGSPGLLPLIEPLSLSERL
jgi:hypothetical protein